MPTETKCSFCGRGYRVRDELVGKKIRCKECDKPFQVVDVADDDQDWEEVERPRETRRSGSRPPAEGKSLPKRRSSRSSKSKKSSGSRSKSGKSTVAGKPAWHVPLGVIGLFMSGAFTIFILVEFFRGNISSPKGVIFWGVVGGVSGRWVFSKPAE